MANEVVVGSKYSIHSELLGETREYWVSLPDSYDLESESHKTYPILIVLDGRSHFRSVSGMHSFMSTSRSGSRRVPEMIIVGVASTNRERDFTPDKIVTRRENETGGGDNFLNFLETEFIPFLNNTYRSSSFKVLMGHSLGGLLVTHAYLKAESTFNAFIAIDPSFGNWDADTMDQKVETATDSSLNRFLYIATANWGTRNLRNRDRHVRFYESLHRRAGSDQFRAQLEYFEDENHGSVPLMAFYNGMSTLFEGYGMTYRDVTSSEQVASHYEVISDRLSHDFKPPEELVNRAGYQMLRQDDEKQKASALELFELNASNYPMSFNAFDSLGEAYHAMGETKKAIESYQRSLELNAGNENAKTQIKVLEKQKG
jgi:predicted alpha/beta superfamily hydrolase